VIRVHPRKLTILGILITLASGVTLGRVTARTTAPASLSSRNAAEMVLMSGCTSPASAQFTVTVPPQFPCQEGEGSKFTIDVQTEHCLRSGQLVCTMMVGGKLEVIIGNKNNNNPNDDGEIKLDPGVIE